ncbi:aminotransferase class IV [Clostridium algidicarnis]|uniref:aminotransferase class IV n=1 Tax=Clostridium algidicarnis TaxID=37659 RepID=UPI001FA7021F|nr:aminotransferase class IV [Clostridium algidicarnis]
MIFITCIYFMVDCINKFLIKNGKIKKCADFNNDFIYSGINVYEVIRVVNGVPLFFEKHIKRMEKSMKLIDMKLPYSYETCKGYVKELIELNGKLDGNIKIVINADKPKKDFIMFYINHAYPTESDYKEGVRTILYHGERDNPNAKIVNDDFREKINEKINDKQVYEAILVDKNGKVTEGSKSNIFFIKEDCVITSPISEVLPGITRDEILEICLENKINVKEEGYKYEELMNLDGAFISGTSPSVLPIKYIDENLLNSTQNGIIKIITDKYREKVKDYINYWV